MISIVFWCLFCDPEARLMYLGDLQEKDEDDLRRLNNRMIRKEGHVSSKGRALKIHSQKEMEL